MKGNKKTRVKHIPMRTCVACRVVLPKRSLIRVVKTTEGIVIDPNGKLAGRGAYLHDQAACWQKGLQGSLSQALKTVITKEEEEELRKYAATLSSEVVSEKDT